MFELMNNMFDDFYKDLKVKGNMPTDIVEGENEYILSIDIPGVAKDNINVSYEDSYLTVSVTRKEENNDEKYLRHEILSYDTSRSYYLENIDEASIKAKLENGVLTIKATKVEPTLPEKKYIAIE